jgi:hypothetical protein
MHRITTPALVAGGTVAVVAGGAFARSRRTRDIGASTVDTSGG